MFHLKVKISRKAKSILFSYSLFIIFQIVTLALLDLEI